MNARAKAMSNLYRRDKITKEGLKKAVEDKVITAAEYQIITGEALS